MGKDRQDRDNRGNGSPPLLDPEGGNAHHAEVLAVNTLKQIIAEAKTLVIEEVGWFTVPAEVMDRLIIKCEKVLLNYGEEEALEVMKAELKDFLKRLTDYKERDDERKVKASLPDDTLRK